MIICRRQHRSIDARFSHLYFCQSLYTLQRGLPAIAGLLVYYMLDQMVWTICAINSYHTIKPMQCDQKPSVAWQVSKIEQNQCHIFDSHRILLHLIFLPYAIRRKRFVWTSYIIIYYGPHILSQLSHERLCWMYLNMQNVAVVLDVDNGNRCKLYASQ